MATEFDHIKMRLDDHGKGSIEINGKEVKGTMGFTLKAYGGFLSVVTIHFLSPSIDIEAPAKVIDATSETSISPIEWQQEMLAPEGSLESDHAH